MRQAFGSDADPNTTRTVVFITDGQETCKGDPCVEARELAGLYKGLKIHVIDVTGTSQLQCLAEITNGTIARAGDLTELKAAVARAANDVHRQMSCLPADEPRKEKAASQKSQNEETGALKSAAGPRAPPSSPPQEPAPTPAAKGTNEKLSLNEQLERSTALVIAVQSGSTGSGFFVAPDLLVTNRHVVEGSSGVARDILVTSRSLGRPLRGEVIALSEKSAIGGRDYAVVRLRDAPPAAPEILPIAGSVEKRVTVIAAGYPGYLVQNDPAMKRLVAGDLSAAPELVLSEGKVQVTHQSQAGVPLVVHSADISQGNSGGPLVDACGRIVAINTFIGVDPKSGRRGLFSLGGADLAVFLQSKGIPVRSVNTACDPG